MTSSSPPQEPPTQESESIGPKGFFKNLFFLAKATEAEIEKQAENKVKRIIEEIDPEKQINDKIKQLNETYEQKFEKKIKELNEKTIKELNENYEQQFEKAKKELNKITLTCLAIGVILAIAGSLLVLLAGPLLPDILSLDLLKADVEDLEEKIEDLKRN